MESNKFIDKINYNIDFIESYIKGDNFNSSYVNFYEIIKNNLNCVDTPEKAYLVSKQLSFIRKNLTVLKIEFIINSHFLEKKYSFVDAINNKNLDLIRLFYELSEDKKDINFQSSIWHYVVSIYEDDFYNMDEEDSTLDILMFFASKFKNESLNLKDKDNLYLLEKAIKLNKENFACLLIDLGANIEIIGQKGRTPLHLAVKFGLLETVKKLAENGADFHALEHISQNTPLHLAIRSNHWDIARLLINHGSSADIPNKYGCTAIEFFEDCTGLEGDFIFSNVKCPFKNEKCFRKHLSGYWNIDGKTQIGPFEIEYNGQYTKLFYLSIIGKIREFFDQIDNFDQLTLFFETVSFIQICYFNKMEDDQIIINKYLNGENLIFLSGHDKHLVNVIFADNFMYIVNRGDSRAEQSIVCYHIKRNLNAEEIKIILKLKTNLSEEEWHHFLYFKLPETIKNDHFENPEDDFIYLNTFNNIFQKSQKTGNCYYITLMTTFYAIALHEKLKEIKTQENIKLKEQKGEEILQEVTTCYKNLKDFIKVNYFFQYLNEKINEKLTDNLTFDPDIQLVNKIYNKFQEQPALYRFNLNMDEKYYHFISLFENK